jgi:cell division protein FtsB
MSGPLTTWFAGLVMGALFGLAAGLCWVLPKLICALNRLAELEAEVDWRKANDEFGCECQRRYYKETQARIRELEAEVERLKDIIEAMYSCGTRTGVEELYAEYNKEVMGDE